MGAGEERWLQGRERGSSHGGLQIRRRRRGDEEEEGQGVGNPTCAAATA